MLSLSYMFHLSLIQSKLKKDELFYSGISFPFFWYDLLVFHTQEIKIHPDQISTGNWATDTGVLFTHLLFIKCFSKETWLVLKKKKKKKKNLATDNTSFHESYSYCEEKPNENQYMVSIVCLGFLFVWNQNNK